jgi:SPX domain protein involved in polyphosphate accumulation
MIGWIFAAVGWLLALAFLLLAVWNARKADEYAHTAGVAVFAKQEALKERDEAKRHLQEADTQLDLQIKAIHVLHAERKALQEQVTAKDTEIARLAPFEAKYLALFRAVNAPEEYEVKQRRKRKTPAESAADGERAPQEVQDAIVREQ